MKTASDHNAQTRMIEAQGNTQAKLIEAHAKFLTAQAGMVTAVASANKTNAEALKHMEETRTLQLDNSEKRAEVFYAKRAMYERNRDAARLRQPVPTNEDIRRRSKASTPERLSEEQINASRKEIHWPSLLQQDVFEDHRIEIEYLFFHRYSSEQDIRHDVLAITNEMEEELRSLIREVPPSEYMEARRFISNLAYEARFAS